MKKNMKTLSAIAVSGLLLGLAATPAFAEHDQATGKTDGHADHGCCVAADLYHQSLRRC